MKTYQSVAAAAGVLFVSSHFLPAYEHGSGWACFLECWKIFMHFSEQGLGAWLYYSAFVVDEVGAVILILALFFSNRAICCRRWIAVVMTLHVLSWLVLNVQPGERNSAASMRVGYFVWLLSYILLCVAHVLAKRESTAGISLQSPEVRS